jgi:secreted trypsin-like serine protease
MKLFLLAILINLSCANVLHYHKEIGVPEAMRIKIRESSIVKGPTDSRIFNGNRVTLGEHPYFGGLIIRLSPELLSVCGSTLISSTNLITAAHCWSDGEFQAELYEVVLGSTTLFSGGTRIITNDVKAHPDYDSTTVRNDIAVITVPQVAFTNYIQPIKLPDNSNIEGILAEAVGFGKTGDENLININQYLSATHIMVIKRTLCMLFYGDLLTTSMICTEGIYGSPCSGDSGGPLLYRNNASEAVMIGIVSYGASYGCELGLPIVYTKVSDYVDWIKDF